MTSRSARSLLWTLATTTSTRAEQVVLAVQGAVFEDVDLNAAEDAERRQPLIQLRDHLQLLPQAFRAQAVGDR